MENLKEIFNKNISDRSEYFSLMKCLAAPHIICSAFLLYRYNYIVKFLSLRPSSYN